MLLTRRHSRFAPTKLKALLDGIAGAIDRVGGSFTMNCVTVTVAASRQLASA